MATIVRTPCVTMISAVIIINTQWINKNSEKETNYNIIKILMDYMKSMYNSGDVIHIS